MPTAVLVALGILAAADDAPWRPLIFGVAISDKRGVHVREVVARPDDYIGKLVVVVGEVRRSSKRKGNWIELAATAQTIAPGVLVTFKDDGFVAFRKQANSPDMLAQGEILRRTLSAAEVKRLEREGLKFPQKARDGTVLTLTMIATGVELGMVRID